MKPITFFWINLWVPFSMHAQYDHLRKEINTLIRYETTIDYSRTPGFIVGMIDGDSTYILSFGQRSPEEHTAILQQDIFELGGVTKLFTAMIADSMLREQKIELHRSINTYLTTQNAAFDSCTIFNLLTHTSGLPKYPPGWGTIEQDSQDPYAVFSQSNLEFFLKNYTAVARGNEKYFYSHLNYVILSWVLETVSKMSYADLLKKYLPDLPGITLSKPPSVNGYAMNLSVAKPWTSQSYAAALGVRGSVLDLIHTAQIFLTEPTAYKEMLKPYPVIIRNKKAWVAIGWQIVPIAKNRFIYAHTGKTRGHHSFIGIFPETKTGVVVLANAAAGSDVLGLSILGMMNKNWKRKG